MTFFSGDGACGNLPQSVSWYENADGGRFLSVQISVVYYTTSTLGKKFSRRHFKIFPLFFPENRFYVKTCFLEKTENIITLSSAE